jgi:acyl dehydratase
MRWSVTFDDLEVGDAFSTEPRTVTEADVAGFAALTGDFHPQHTDPAWAARSPFGERIAHGMLVVSMAVGLVPFDPDRLMALRRIGDVVFKRPLRLGETITVDGTITSLRPIDDAAGLVAWDWKVRNEEGRLVCRATVEVLWRRSQSAPTPYVDETWALVGDGVLP